MERMKAAIQNGKTDVAPTRGDPDYYALNTWTGGPAPRLSAAFRIPVTVLSTLPVLAGMSPLMGISGWILWGMYLVFAVWSVRLYGGGQA